MEITATTINSQTKYYSIDSTNVAGWNLKDVNGSTTYLGYSLTEGASGALPVWRIRKEVTSGNITTATYADGDGNYDNIWNNRASLTYL